MFGRRIRQIAEGVASHTNQAIDKSEKLMDFLAKLAQAMVDDVRDFIKEAGDEVNIEATVKFKEGFNFKDLFSGELTEIPVSLNFKVKVAEEDQK